MDTIFTDTSVTFSSSTLFPNVGEIERIVVSGGGFAISAVAGPLKKGTEGNVTGDGIGFFYGWTFCEFGIFILDSKYSERKREEPRNRLQKFLEQRAKKLSSNQCCVSPPSTGTL